MNTPQDGERPRRVLAFADKGFILTLSDYRMDLGAVGLELGVSGTILEVYRNGKWVMVSSDTPIPITKGGILAIRAEGVTDVYNWDIDKKFIL
jgi:hypothetical protein